MNPEIKNEGVATHDRNEETLALLHEQRTVTTTPNQQGGVDVTITVTGLDIKGGAELS